MLMFVGCILYGIHPAAGFQSEPAAKIQEYRAQLAADANQPDIRLQLAKVYLHIEAYEQAVAEYQHVIGTAEIGKSTEFLAAEAFYGLGLAYAGLEKFDVAITAYQKARAISPDWAHIHAALGSAYVHMHRYEEALAAYTIAVELQPDAARIHHHLGNVHSKRGERDKALRHQLRAIALAPTLAAAHYQLGRLYAQQQRWDDAIAAYQNAYAHDAELLQALYHLAQTYRRRGNTAAAREHMARFEEQKSLLNPVHQLRGALQRTQDVTERAQIFTNIGRLYLKSGDAEKAAWAYQKAIAQAPQLAAAYNGLGIAYAMQEKYPEALTAQQKALARQPDFAKAHAGLGFVYFQQNRAELALKHYRQAVALEPQFLEAHRKIGLILLNQKRYVEAGAAYQTLLTLNPKTDAEAYHNLGLCYAYQGETESALDALETTVTLCSAAPVPPPFLVETNYLIGELQAARGQVDAAAAAYLASGLPKAYHALAQLYAKRGVKLTSALAYAQKAIALNPNVASYYNTLARIAYRKGDYRLAETAIRRAIALEPENRNYREGLKQILKR